MELKATRIKQVKADTVKVTRGTGGFIQESRTPTLKAKGYSNYSKLIAYSRIPNKDHHFHEKTYESTFLPKVFFKSSSRLNRSQKYDFSLSPSLNRSSFLSELGKDRRVTKHYVIPAYFPSFRP
jgi:hypothetical protein